MRSLSCYRKSCKNISKANNELEKIRYIDHRHLQTKTIYTYFKADGQPGSLEKGLTRVCEYVTDAIEDGFTIIILSVCAFTDFVII